MENSLLNSQIYDAGAADIDLDAVFNCGQCFRWEPEADGSYTGIAFGRKLNISLKDGRLLLRGAGKTDYDTVWREYFDLARDYAGIRRTLSKDPVLKKAVRYAPGIRILRQEPWEALCSFIISQNNNIPRIRGIIARLCEHFGEPVGCGYAFPSAQVLCKLDETDLAPLRCGFRARYILDAARKVASGEIDLAALTDLPLDEARSILMKIKGVGPKVADCALLFGCGRLDSFPVDVWVKRVLANFYPSGFPEDFHTLRGIAQQYLFHYARCCPESGLA